MVACVHHHTQTLDLLLVWHSGPRDSVREPWNSISTSHTWAVLCGCVSCAWRQRGSVLQFWQLRVVLENTAQLSRSLFPNADVRQLLMSGCNTRALCLLADSAADLYKLLSTLEEDGGVGSFLKPSALPQCADPSRGIPFTQQIYLRPGLL